MAVEGRCYFLDVLYTSIELPFPEDAVHSYTMSFSIQEELGLASGGAMACNVRHFV